ncbi:inorganic phosphate transporter [Halopiger aswanensis]|uniref:Phosphate transporter n=1 Tax=Halopiger aswanensis TaxID=148449 RepID=A0A419WEC7_9EURY|nr:inorganic phosphate transporter [Halopiger aswanensis]RKD93803.1 PiT family inorganic phosphate transporter [Halopiger aswanensis]
MSELLLGIGVLAAVFVGYNVGGSTTGPAFGPAIGAGVIGKGVAAALMSGCFLLGALTVGPEVVLTLSRDLLRDPSVFTLRSSVAVLLVIGGALFLGNYAGVPASTSMTAVGAIAALGSATGTLAWSALGEIVVAWLVAPVVGFWVAGVVGRYWYPRLAAWLALEERGADRARARPMVTVVSSGLVPWLRIRSTDGRRQRIGAAAVVGVGCLMAYASGTSNVANAVAPLYAIDALELDALILLGSGAVALGAFTIARRTLETLGDDLTRLPLPAAIIVAVISSVLVVALSAVGIPASFVVIATTCIIGLGWGRATRTTTLADAARGEDTPVSVGALAADDENGDSEPAPPIGEETASDVPATAELFDPATTARVLVVQNLVPAVATVGAFVLFRFAPVVGA